MRRNSKHYLEQGLHTKKYGIKNFRMVPPATLAVPLPGIVARAGKAVVFAAEEFFFGRIRNEHTRAAYLQRRRHETEFKAR